jgi:peptidoglycan/xylan/chitin deacetylase (PgdA/CDA1 family)
MAGYRYTVMWDVDTIDWLPVADGGPTTAEIVTKVLTNAEGGSIVLMHLGGYNTLAALPAIIDGLRSRGFVFVTLSEMFGE